MSARPRGGISSWVAGLDWACDPKNRVISTLEATGSDGLRLTTLRRGVDDASAACYCRDSRLAAIGIDIPFGWPSAFTRFIAGWNASGEPPGPVPDSAGFRYRLTDLEVSSRLGKHPLSVSTDRIGLASRAWVEVVQHEKLGSRIDRGFGSGAAAGPALIEVYPGGTLASLFNCRPEVMHERYKADLDVRRGLVDVLVKDFQLDLGPHEAKLVETAKRWDELDALVAALTAAIYAGLVPGREIVRPAGPDRTTVEREGWIFYPEPRGDPATAPRPRRTRAPAESKRPHRLQDAPTATGHERTCPACGTFVFRRWPWGWDSHSHRCEGLSPGTHEERKREFKSRFGDGM